MKKIVILAVVIMLLLVGCKPSSSDSSDKPTSVTESTLENVTTTTEIDTDTTTSQSSESTEDTTAATSAEDTATVPSNAETTTVPSKTTPTTTQKPDSTSKLSLKRGLNLSGPFESTDKPYYDSWILNKDYFILIKNKGFDHVRIPVNFSAHAGAGPEYKLDKEFMNQLDTAVNHAISVGLIAVIDYHGWSAMNGNADGNKQEFYTVWEQVAKRYQKYPDAVYFELLNEPTPDNSGVSPLSTKKLNEIQNEVIKVIRKTNPTRKIVTTVNEWNSVWNVWNMELPVNDKNLIVSLHNYSTMEFTHQGATWSGYDNVPRPFTDAVKAEIIRSLDYVKDYTDRTGREVWLSEWGVYLGIADINEVAKYAKFFRTEAEKRGFSWCYWEFNVGFGVYDHDKGEWKDILVKELVP